MKHDLFFFFDKYIRVEADATVQPNGLLRLTDQKPNTIGTTFYRKAVRLLESHRNASVRSFNTCIVFAINPTSSKEGGYGFTFTLSTIPDIQDVSITNENPRNHVFAVDFDTVQGFEDGYHRMGNHVGVNFNSLQSDFEGPRIYCMTETQN
ncbi:BnaC09g18530D [Brassica napus]|uniref:BnaC09g18530D protein n=1 Tax=Brassica napus TaxID=3708 RepID=A0A078GCQ2_BRANA|nr:BnaC09g18530D [Brassica napus]